MNPILERLKAMQDQAGVSPLAGQATSSPVEETPPVEPTETPPVPSNEDTGGLDLS